MSNKQSGLGSLFDSVFVRLALAGILVWGGLTAVAVYQTRYQQGVWDWQPELQSVNYPRVLAANDQPSPDYRQQQVLAWKQRVTNHPLPQLTARAWLIKDLNLDYEIASFHPDVPFPPASTTKLMTAWVAAKHYQWNQSLQVPRQQWIGSQMGLKPGETIEVSNLLYGLLLTSGNDAAEVLAYHYPGGRQAFVKRMNYWAKKWDLGSTYFQNPSGLDEPGHYSSARDLAVIAQKVLVHPLLKSIVATTEAEIFPQQTGERHYRLSNINDLLSQVPGAYGVKTGYTQEAGEVLISSVKQADKDLLVVVMGSQDRFDETKQLLAWAGLEIDSGQPAPPASASADSQTPASE